MCVRREGLLVGVRALGIQRIGEVLVPWVAVVGDEGPGACSIVVGEDGFRGADSRSVKEGLGSFGEREGGDVVRCFEGGEGGEVGQA